MWGKLTIKIKDVEVVIFVVLQVDIYGIVAHVVCINYFFVVFEFDEDFSKYAS